MISRTEAQLLVNKFREIEDAIIKITEALKSVIESHGERIKVLEDQVVQLKAGTRMSLAQKIRMTRQ